MPMKFASIFTSLILLYTIAGAQETGIFTDREATYKRGKELFDKHLFGPASMELKKYLSQPLDVSHSASGALRLEAEQKVKLSALYLNIPQGEKELVDFVYRYSPDPVIDEPSLALGSFYYNNKQYTKSVYFYDKIHIPDLEEDKRAESNFKKGYGYFVNRSFDEAAVHFRDASQFQGAYYYPTNYYLGMCNYFAGDTRNAVRNFEKVSKSPTFGPLVPYYITQIYFAEEQYDELIEYGERIITLPATQNIKEIRLLLGQTYFKRGLYSQALPHLAFYEANTPRLTQEEFYQLAFTQYKLGMYQTAVKTFMEIALLESKLGQLVNYYMADSYVHLGDLASARSAFRKVSGMDYEKSMQAEAVFNYGKLSAQLNFDREAINTLVKIDKNSPFFTEARKIINEILLYSADYSNSISIMESLSDWSDDLQATYQIIAYKKAVQLIREQNYRDARAHLDKSNRYIVNGHLHRNGLYWRGYMLGREGQHRNSITALDQYLEAMRGQNHVDDEASTMTAHYFQAYNYLKLNDFNRAAQHFKNTITSINNNRQQISNTEITDRLYPDAVVRAGDCLFRLNKYEEAYTFYDNAVKNKLGNYDYAQYQKALILGLTNRPYDKINVLEDLIRTQPRSDLADDALFQLGETYLTTGNLNPASQAFSTLVSQYKGRSPLINASLLKLGLITFNLGDSRKALGYYKDVFNNQSNAKESQEALTAIEEIYIRDIGDSDAYFKFVQSIPGYQLTDFKRDSLNYQIARSRYDQGDYDRAIELFSDYLTKNPNGIYKLEAYYYRAESRSITRKFSDALKDYNYLIVMGFNPYYHNSLRKAGIIAYNYEQDFSRAYQYFSALSEAPVPKDQLFEANIGAMRSAFRLSDHEGVIKFAPKVIVDDLTTESEIESAYYYLGKSYFNTGSFANAMEVFKKIENVNSNQAAEATYLMALIHMRQGRTNEAEQTIEMITEMKSNYPQWVARSIILYGEIYLSKNDVFNARAALEAVIENFSDNEGIVRDAQNILAKVEAKEQELNRIKTPDNEFMQRDTTGRN